MSSQITSEELHVRRETCRLYWKNDVREIVSSLQGEHKDIESDLRMIRRDISLSDEMLNKMIGSFDEMTKLTTDINHMVAMNETKLKDLYDKAEAITDTLASVTGNLIELKTELKDTKTDNDFKISGVKTDINSSVDTKITSLKQELGKQIGDMKEAMKKYDKLLWLITAVGLSVMFIVSNFENITLMFGGTAEAIVDSVETKPTH